MLKVEPKMIKSCPVLLYMRISKRFARIYCFGVVLTLTPPYNNAVRGHRTDSNNSGVEDYLRRKKTEK